MHDMRVHFLSTTSRTGRPSGSMRLEPTASITSSNGLLSQEYTNRFVLGIPMPPAKICQVGVSIVTWHAVHARSKSPSCTPASSPLLPMPTSSTLIAPGNSSLSPRIIPRGNDAEHTSILDKPVVRIHDYDKELDSLRAGSVRNIIETFILPYLLSFEEQSQHVQ